MPGCEKNLSSGLRTTKAQIRTFLILCLECTILKLAACILGGVRYLIVSTPDLCTLIYFYFNILKASLCSCKHASLSIS